MSALDVEAITDIAPGLSPVTAIHYGRIQVMLFRSHLAEFAEEDLVYAMDNSVVVFGEEALLMVAPDESSIAICTYPVGLMMMEWGNWDILAVSPPSQTPTIPSESVLGISNQGGANVEQQEQSSHTIEMTLPNNFFEQSSVTQSNGTSRPRNQFVLYYQWLLDTLFSEDPSLSARSISQIVAGLWNSEHPAAKARFRELAEMEVQRHRAENPHLYPDQPRFPTTDPVPPRMRYPCVISPEDRQRILRMLDFVWEESNGQLAAEEAALNDVVQPQQAEEVGPFPDFEWEEPNHIIDMSTDLSVAQDPDFMMTEDDSMRFLLKQAC
ncbi:mating type protein [Neurospora intermedia]|uniref:Mating type protein n=1 Tax=Neurospora intermedia TaxID=5142 RepID=A0ABR3D7Q1_NEUIN